MNFMNGKKFPINIFLLFNPISKRKIFFVFADVILIAFSVIAAFLIRFELAIPQIYFQNIEGIIVLSTLITVPIFYFFRLYSFSWIYVSAGELVSLIKGTLLSFLLLTSSFFVLRDHQIFSGFPRSTLFISYFLIFFFCGGIRFAKRIYLQLFSNKNSEKKEKVLIVGAGGAGEQMLRNILNSKNSPYFPVGFIDDNPEKKGLLIHGLKILGAINDIPEIAKEKNIDSLIVAFPSAGSALIKRAEEKGIEAGIMDIKYLPPMDELINSADKIGVGELRDIDLEDLLGREATELEQKPIEEFLKNKKILITGAAGSIGSELCRQVAKFNPEFLVILDQDETGVFNILSELKDRFPILKIFSIIADIREEEKIKQIFKKYSPRVVFHAAAYKHVHLMEENVDEAIKNNIFGTKIIADAALENNAEKFVFISTDKAVNPSSVMGATKRIGEMICQLMNKRGKTRFVSVRFGNVLGSRGSVIPVFKEQMSNGKGPITITHKDMKRYFMVTSEACLLVMQAGAMGQGGEVFVLDMGSPVKIIDLARKLISLSGFVEGDIKIDYIGPRPGEKLFEELLTAEEGTNATQNQKIFIAKNSEIDNDKLNLGIEKLKNSTVCFSREDMVKNLQEIIPFYKK
jgi:FlaA1/EpsC-like NDP-sugar epimerase